MRKWIWILLICSNTTLAAEHSVSAIIDTRLSHTQGIDSYANGGLGKFRFDEGNQLSLAQAGLTYKVDWENPLSAQVTANGYIDGTRDGIGLTEAFIKYRGLPLDNGLRLHAKLGLMYPSISLENIATAWSSPYTLSYSAINSWLGEEFRHLGAELTLERLGKFHSSMHDFSVSAAIFQNNDTVGAMLAWHGWTISSRQTLSHETLPLSNMPSLDGGSLDEQARDSDPFIELDNRFGYHVHAKWKIKGKGEFSFGYYDNNADTTIVKNGQYTWLTQFYHAGMRFRLPYKIELISQFMNGDTLMQSPQAIDVVNNEYQSAFLLLSRRWDKHRLTMRVEHFDVTDNDLTPDDDNNEKGQALTASYQYRLLKNWFIQAEYNYLDSTRPARIEQNLPSTLTEQQYQLATRWYF
ncbi:hypothetical protein Q4601_01730 [Shewanella sp. 1_MG-2023]|uniref:hypothetical protein n=1 Tax=unclassified Shewanella TaxID=196818 RepID=UPI0026E441AB|nr:MULTISPECIES: hypothetical protein [unclassified Shewanella]MDO6609916.1 hypothetical protein [Shewanella sp. 7_MG-2023]MDO6769942.1 hypothetical protein [Shewanella sp. 2_MG-2023]MDO6793006.1 hypothetical protein [Shewanella sp. 1_MG-2023]